MIAGVMEHVEEAGVHSGDSACSLPPYSLPPAMRWREIERQAEALARALEVRGLMNVQMAVKDGEVFILEVNPRASRTVPFVAKADRQPDRQDRRPGDGGRAAGRLRRCGRSPTGHVAVKEAVFPFARFPGVDLLLGPEMKSTGEVMGLDRDFAAAFVKSQLGAGTELPRGGHGVRLGARPRQGGSGRARAGALRELGFELAATRGTAAALAAAGLPVTAVKKVHEGRPHIVDLIKNGGIAHADQHHRGPAGDPRQLLRCGARR